MSFCAKPERRACLPDAPRAGYGDSRLLADDALRAGVASSRPAMLLPAEGRLRAGAKASACGPPCVAQALPPAGAALLAGAKLYPGLGFCGRQSGAPAGPPRGASPRNPGPGSQGSALSGFPAPPDAARGAPPRNPAPDPERRSAACAGASAGAKVLRVDSAEGGRDRNWLGLG